MDRASGAGLCLQLPDKVVTDYVINSVVAFIDGLGHDVVTVSSDNEPVCHQVLAKVKDKRVKTTHVKFAPRYSSQSKGAVESYIGHIQGQIRTTRLAAEEKLGVQVTPQHHSFPWLVRHAEFSKCRYFKKSTGRSAYEDAFNEEYSSVMLPLFESVFFRMPMSKTGRLLQG